MNCKRVPCKLSQRGAGVGVETKKERKEGERTSGQRKGRERARKGHDSSGTRLHPSSSKRVRPASRALRPGQRPRKGQKEATSPSWPSFAPLEGLVGAVKPSPDREPQQRPHAPSEGADCGAPRAFRGPAFTPPPPEEPAPGDAGPAPGGCAGYLKRGESFRHSSKSTVIFILPPPRLASQGALEEPREPRERLSWGRRRLRRAHGRD